MSILVDTHYYLWIGGVFGLLTTLAWLLCRTKWRRRQNCKTPAESQLASSTSSAIQKDFHQILHHEEKGKLERITSVSRDMYELLVEKMIGLERSVSSMNVAELTNDTPSISRHVFVPLRNTSFPSTQLFSRKTSQNQNKSSFEHEVYKKPLHTRIRTSLSNQDYSGFLKTETCQDVRGSSTADARCTRSRTGTRQNKYLRKIFKGFSSCIKPQTN
ncbi:uncharacterized protein LOC130654614 [Hydractinia symbiolongicarpus]|uniref:uncharacterized protein LOC130654614 n=1 Tax=Hydractinia symbiolongicarpus TaxID=13093 RepID=UPI00254E9C09|nr:uncharacterized protein LOC130654614 [Hydractinia symbiolongicarpus]